jgi:predicted PurR-regulated permease PerM
MLRRWQETLRARERVEAEARERTLRELQALESRDPGSAVPLPVPRGVEVAAGWSWRLLVIAAAVYGGIWLLGFLAPLTVPLAVAMLVAALAAPAVSAVSQVMPRGVAAFLVVLSGLVLIFAMLTLAGTQVATGSTDLANQVNDGLDEVLNWLQSGPLHLSDAQINNFVTSLQNLVKSSSSSIAGVAGGVGAKLGELVAGFFVVLFATYFFLSDGDRIWSWLVRIFPRVSRAEVDSSGRVAWRSLTKFVRATVIVALTDSLGIMIVAMILRVPFIAAIGLLVFLGAFIPLVGATISGSVAVLVALVSHGPLAALLMLLGVVAVQQIEAHLLQPFLMGRFVSVHPLGIILAIGVGVLSAGIAGALIAVPLAAAGNAVVNHLAELHEAQAQDALQRAAAEQAESVTAED